MHAMTESRITRLTTSLFNLNPAKNPGLRVAIRAIKRKKRAFDRCLGLQAPSSFPPLLCNSIPKSGTNLLVQLLQALPAVVSYDSLILDGPAHTLKRRGSAYLQGQLAQLAPAECAMCHLEYSQEIAEAIAAAGAAHFFIIRDPRDVAVSELHFLSRMAFWHAAYPYLTALPSDTERLDAIINGFDLNGGIHYPSIAEKLAAYRGWLAHDNICTVRFEELATPDNAAAIRRIASHFTQATHAVQDIRLDDLVTTLQRAIDPRKSKTYRHGKSGGWKAAFSESQLRRLYDTAQHEFIAYGYDMDAETDRRPGLPPQ
jgi:hypothetical protein